jgi:hypothetical protein
VPAWYWLGFISSSRQFWMVWCVLHKRRASMLLSVVLTPRALVLGCCCTANMVWRDYGLGTQCKNSHGVSHLMTKRFAMVHGLLCGELQPVHWYAHIRFILQSEFVASSQALGVANINLSVWKCCHGITVSEVFLDNRHIQPCMYTARDVFLLPHI